ncbi:hypothetical protein GCM10018790_63810 [Kitasatospora xanthocidica]|uniref:hypothetical protein n=1 Tax=Kitasatospora xanthocidica TaxID=83382 RepID=UPI0016766530|nr:hypothetical protein [Kitasatospora xanthocidica]GHF76981.1 hypothetical protein GCM10018790_63810 [Kitasatospora xanthocidica]
MHPTGPVARRFPLVARHRPACLPLDARVGRLCELADTASRQADPGLASTIFNQAALLASDLALPGYARELCHRHAALHLTRGPLPATSAIRGLEPIINLARLHTRAGRHQRGHRLLLDLYRAVTSGTEAATEATLDGITLPTRLTETDQQRHEVRQWLWRVVLADGARALTSAGHWSDALRHIEAHRGIGRRMFDGRQVAVLARATTRDLTGALTLVEETEAGAPWEDAVTAVLTALCRPGNRQAAETAVDLCLTFEPNEGLNVFTTRLALSALDATEPDTPAARNLVEQLSSRTGESGDGYALRDLLAHEGVRRRLDPGRTAALERSLATCALGSAILPEPIRDRLEEALSHARNVLEKSPFTPGSPGGNPLEQRARPAPTSDAAP